MLVAAGVLGEDQLRAALAHQRGKGQRIGEALVEPVSYTHLTLPTNREV